MAAVDVLEQIAERGCEDAIVETVQLLEHDSIHVRQAAILALCAIADKGDQCALSEVDQRLDHDDKGVRSTIMHARNSLDAPLIHGASVKLDETEIKCVMVQQLGRVGAAWEDPKLKQKAKEMVSQYFDDTVASVRRAALLAFAKVADKGDEIAIEQVKRLLLDEDERVAYTAVDVVNFLDSSRANN